MSANELYAAWIDCLKTPAGEERERKKHRLPAEAYAESDCEYFFTVCAHPRLGRPFLDARLARSIIDSLLWRKQRHGWTLYCYCLMPDHLHFIAKLVDHSPVIFNAGARGMVPVSIIDHIARFKRYTTTQIWWSQGGRGSLWQRSSYDRVIRYNQSIDPVVRYVLDNPVRKGLVSRWDEYPYSAIVDEWA